MITVSYVIPIYNTPERLLRYGLDILVKEKNNKCEILLIDDGSELNIMQICDEYSRVDSRVKVFHQKNQGVSVARNVGIDNAKGKYIVFIDPDDYVLSDFLRSDVLEQSDDELIVFDYIRKDYDGKETIMSIDGKTVIDKIKLIENAFFCDDSIPDCFGGAVWAKAFRRDFLLNNDIRFDPKLRKAQDRVFMLYVYNALNSMKYIDMPIYVYFENFESICNSYSKSAIERSMAFANAVAYFFDNNSIKGINSKVLVAKVFLISYFECIYLDLFNIKNEDKYINNRNKAVILYKKMEMLQHMNDINIEKCFGTGEKIKFVLIKYKLLGLLYMTIQHRQKKRKKDTL